jgi:hypothetical protein
MFLGKLLVSLVALFSTISQSCHGFCLSCINGNAACIHTNVNLSLEWFEVDLCAFFKIEAEGDMSPLFPLLFPSPLSAEHYLRDLIRSRFLLLSYLLLTLSSSTIALAGVFSLNLHH